MAFFFIMCSERSGSNLTTKLMNSHPDVCGPSTKHIINPVARNLFRYEPLEDRRNWEELLRDIHRLLEVDFSVWKKRFSLRELERCAPAGDAAGLIRGIFYAEAGAHGKKRLFIKENQVYEFLPFLLLNFPEAKYLYQARDPRDMALSWKKSREHPGGVVRAARQWQKDQQNTLKNHCELARRGRSFFLRYEELISQPEETLRKLLSFLGLPFDRAMLNFHEDETTRANAARLPAWENLGRALMRDNKEKYRRELSAEEIKAIEKTCYYEMLCLGYRPNFSRDRLEKFPEEAVRELAAREAVPAPGRSAGVERNIAAKAVFYRKLPGKV